MFNNGFAVLSCGVAYCILCCAFSVQAITVRIFGFGFPHYPHGRWYSPLAHAEKVTVRELYSSVLLAPFSSPLSLLPLAMST